MPLLSRRLEQKGVRNDPDPVQNTEAKNPFQRMQDLPDWRNAHDVEYLTKEIFGKCLDNMDLITDQQQPLQVSTTMVTSCRRAPSIDEAVEWSTTMAGRKMEVSFPVSPSTELSRHKMTPNIL